MQRFPSPSCGGGIGNSAVGGSSSRESARSDSSFAPSNFPLNARRQLQIPPYKIKCDKEPLSTRLGPADFYPQTPNCPEETLTSDYVNHGYREIAEGIEESREILLTQQGSIDETRILKCKEAIRKCLRAINESRTQKRKAGQVYEVPLTGQLLLKPGVFPEQRPCTEDFKKKWIEGLSQQNKRLHSLADHVPHGYRRRSLFEVLIRHNVPLLRATWFIKITYLNQVRPASIGVSSGSPDKTLLTRTELWTKDVTEYLQQILDEFLSKDGYISSQHGRDHSQMAFSSALQRKDDTQPILLDCEEPTLQFKWWYMVRILQWHHSEGLVLPSHVIEWVLKQLQEKDSIEALQLLLPVIFDMVESIMLSQTYVRTLVDVALRYINGLSSSDCRLPDNFDRFFTLSALVELVRYLVVSVPDTFVALDCFPLPLSVVSDGSNFRNPFLKDFERVFYVPEEIINNQYISFGYISSSVQKRAANLSTAVSPSLEGFNVAKAVQSLDKSLVEGDVGVAYSCLFENLCDGGMEEGWIEEINPCLRSCLKWIGTVNHSVVHSVFLLCEWATCDFRDSRVTSSLCPNITGKKDFSQVYVAVQLLKLWVENIKSLKSNKNSSIVGPGSVINNLNSSDGASGGISSENASSSSKNDLKGLAGIMDLDVLQSPGAMHDMVVCWLDLHDPSKGEGFKRLYMLIVELIRVGIFYPQAYVRQLIVSGIIDRSETLYDMDKRKRHYRILKQLPGPFLLDALEEAKIAEEPLLNAAVSIYSNERRLVLQGLNEGKHRYLKNGSGISVNSTARKENKSSKKHANMKAEVAEVRAAISMLLGIPNSGSMAAVSQLDVTQANNFKRPIGSVGTTEGTSGCEECSRSKRQKVNEDKLQVPSPNPSDEEDSWWVRKGPMKLLDSSFKMEPPKLTKHVPRGRQKNVRKTQSLAQLAAARIEGSQGASTSHVCENKISCPHHRSGMEGEASKHMDGIKAGCDLVALGKALKQLRLLEKRSISLWLISTIKHLIEGAEKVAAKVGHFGGPYPPSVDERSAVRWKLGEEELSVVLYLVDVSFDLFSAVKFLLWLLPKASMSPSSTVHSGRNILMLPKNTENRVFDVGESFILSAIRRYENILIAGGLFPEFLSAAMHRAIAVTASSGRAPSSAAFIYARNVLKRFGSMTSVVRWEKNFKTTCDQRLLAELETGRVLDSELGFSPIGFPAGVKDVDDQFRQKVRFSRAGPTMKEIVQRHVEEALNFYLGKERKLFPAANVTSKSILLEKSDDGFHIAQQIACGLLDCIRQNAGAGQEGDSSLVAAAVSAVISNVGSAFAKMPDLTSTSNHAPNFSSNITTLTCAKRILNIHISCLSLLKEALGDRQSRVFETALATEAFSIVSAALTPGKSQARSQFQVSPETHDSNSNISNEILNNSTKVFLVRATKAAAAVSALVIGAVVHGITNLERMVSYFKLKESLNVIQFLNGVRSNSNGVSRSVGTYKFDNGIEAYVHWFRVLIGNFRTVLDGLVVELLGEPYAMALSRMQRVLPINLVFPPAYSIFAMVVWRPYIFNSNIAMREDIQLYQSLILAISDAVKHQPFRDICLRDSHAFYEHLSRDGSDADFAAMLETHNSDKHFKMMVFVPLLARLFLNAVLDCKMPESTIRQEDGSRITSHAESKAYVENETKLLDQLVHVLDTLQPAKFHWQWVELRLLLNEQVLMGKIETDMSLVEAIRSLSPNSDNFALSDNENNFMEIVLTRLLVRPDAAPLYSEAIHLLGRSLEESLLKHAKWLLAGNDVLLGRKSIRQRLINVAQLRGLSPKAQFWKPWGWSKSGESSRNNKRKVEASSIEEGEVVEDGLEFKRSGKPSLQMFDVEECNSIQQYVTEKALTELVLPCIDRSSSDSRNTFASDLIKQMNTIEQYISGFIRGLNKQSGMASSGAEGASSKLGSRKGIRGGSPGMGRRAQGVADLPPSSAVALRASIWLRLKFLLRLLPIIYADRESSDRNMRHSLALVLLRLLGSRVVYEDGVMSLYSNLARKGEVDSAMDVSLSPDQSGDSLFDRLLCVFHGLVSKCKPVWMKSSKSASKLTDKSPRDFPVLDREVAESLQAELDRMHLPTAIRQRIQAAMPVLSPSVSLSISCQVPMITSSAFSMTQSSISVMGLQQYNAGVPLRSSPISSSRPPPTTITSSKSKSIPQQDVELEIDPWLLLEDGTGCGSTPGTGNVTVAGDHANLKANNWLKGAVRIKRTDLSYIGAMDDDT